MSESAFDVAIVGAGPAGLGCALALQEVGVERLVVLDSQNVGASFERWPEEMRLITPSRILLPVGSQRSHNKD